MVAVTHAVHHAQRATCVEKWGRLTVRGAIVPRPLLIVLITTFKTLS